MAHINFPQVENVNDTLVKSSRFQFALRMAKKQSKRGLAPGPTSISPLGNFAEFRRDRHEYLYRLHREYGEVVCFRMGLEPFYLVAHPDDILHVLACNSRNYHKSKPYQILSHTVGKQSIILTEDAEWKCQRHQLNPHFKRSNLNCFADMIVDTTTAMLDRWEGKCTGHHQVDIVDEMLSLTMRIICKALFKIDLETEIADVSQAFATVLRIGTPWLESPLGPLFGLIKHLPTQSNRAFHAAIHTLDQLVYRMISERRTSGDQGDLLSALIFATNEDGTAGMSDQELRDQTMTLLIGGHETTASVLAWTFYLLSSHPEEAEKLYAEVDRVLSVHAPTVADLDEMSYCHQVLKEAMRLYPPAPLVGRQALADDNLGGYHIPAGSNIFISQYVTHRHPAFWTRPDAFCPDHFHPDVAKQRPHFAYFPFGGGPRFCLGGSFATLVMRLVLPTIVQRVRLNLVPGHNVKPAALLTLRPTDGLPMAIQPSNGHATTLY